MALERHPLSVDLLRHLTEERGQDRRRRRRRGPARRHVIRRGGCRAAAPSHVASWRRSRESAWCRTDLGERWTESLSRSPRFLNSLPSIERAPRDSVADRQREVDQLSAVRRARHAAHDDVDAAAGDERHAAVRVDGDVGDLHTEHSRELEVEDIDVEADELILVVVDGRWRIVRIDADLQLTGRQVMSSGASVLVLLPLSASPAASAIPRTAHLAPYLLTPGWTYRGGTAPFSDGPSLADSADHSQQNGGGNATASAGTRMKSCTSPLGEPRSRRSQAAAIGATGSCAPRKRQRRGCRQEARRLRAAGPSGSVRSSGRPVKSFQRADDPAAATYNPQARSAWRTEPPPPRSPGRRAGGRPHPRCGRRARPGTT